MIKPWIARELCTGCGACVNICPQNAIKMIEDATGFLYPSIVGECIKCGKCKAVCDKRIEVGQQKNFDNPVVYAAWSKDERIRFLSTSGGIFSELALSIIDRGGVVSGAQYTDDCLVEHVIISDASSLERLRQSKYVQSNSRDIYKRIRNFLKDGRLVLFCGTPCQVAALHSYLPQKEKVNLYTIDFICMGVNSPKAYLAWIWEIEKKQNKKVQKVWFKYKNDGWNKSPFVTRIDFSDGTWMIISGEANKYMQGFLNKKAFIRTCCGECQFKGISRKSDITLGDFWGIDKSLDNDKGTSLVMVNSKKGEKLFHLTAPKIVFHKKRIEDVSQGNVHLYKSVKISDDKNKFFKDLEELNFSAVVDKLKNV